VGVIRQKETRYQSAPGMLASYNPTGNAGLNDLTDVVAWIDSL
jgi:hypothetical protein